MLCSGSIEPHGQAAPLPAGHARKEIPMKSLVIYDSQYGNTQRVAQAIGAALGPEVEVLHVGAVKPEHLTGLSLLVAGSPTQRFNATPAISSLLQGLPAAGLRGVKVAAFDTRFPQSEISKTPALAFFVKLWGRSAWAATHIERGLRQRGGAPVVPPEGFYVGGMEGPLLDGELQRAAGWARQVAAAL
jgi:flavodoxin